MESNLDQLLNQWIEQYHQRLTMVYFKRLDKAKDKEFAITQFVKRMMAFTRLRMEFNSEYRGIIEFLEDDYRLGRPITDSINKLRKMHSKRAQDNYDDFIKLDEDHDNQEIPAKTEGRYSNLDDFSDVELVRLFAQQKGYENFLEFLTEQAQPYLHHITSTELTNFPAEAPEKNKEFTTSRQVLAVHYLLKYCQVKNIDNTEKARFIQFLTGKNYDNIYKRVQSPLNGNDRYINEDLKYVRGYFDRLGMKEIVKMISNELDQAVL
jgi:hypothetical protein